MPKNTLSQKIFSGGPWNGCLFGIMAGEVETAEVVSSEKRF